MNGLNNLRISGLKDLKVNGLRYLGINKSKQMMHKPGSKNDKCIGDLTKSREKVKRQIRELVREKKEIESRIDQLQKARNEENEAMSKFSLQEEIKVEKTDKPDKLNEIGKNEKVDKVEIKAEDIDVKSDSEKTDSKSNEIVGPNQSHSKNVEEFLFPKNDEKTKPSNPVSLSKEKKEGNAPQNSKTESKNPIPGIFGGSLIEELLESEDLYPEEERSFMKYIEESSVVELSTNLREVKKLLAEAGP